MTCTNTSSSLPGAWSPSIYQGATFNPVLTVVQNGAAFNFTGYSAAMTVVDASGDTILSISTAAGTIVLGGTAGTITFAVPATTTAALTPGTYSYDLLVSSSGGTPTVTPIVAGSACVIASPTGAA